MNECERNKCGAGKGDKPRNCFSKQYKDNYDSIDWGHHKRTADGQINEKKKESVNPK